MEILLVLAIPFAFLFVILGIALYDYICNKGGVSSKEFITNVVINEVIYKSEKEKGKIFLDYNGRKLIVSNKAFYEYCKDKKDSIIKVRMAETIYYDHSIGYEVLNIIT